MNTFKFQAAYLNRFGKNAHGFWDGEKWNQDENQSALYNNGEIAELVSLCNGGHGQYFKVIDKEETKINLSNSLSAALETIDKLKESLREEREKFESTARYASAYVKLIPELEDENEELKEKLQKIKNLLD